MLTVQCFTEENSGEIMSNNMVSAVGDIFQNKDFEGLKFSTMTPLKVGANNGWYQQNAKIQFTVYVFS
jgi:hypothetical protein